MTAALRIPRAMWKADEAEFFLPQLRGPQSSSVQRCEPLQPFAFYLSAFLNAAYSCREIAKLEMVQGGWLTSAAFDDWRSKWESELPDSDAKIWTLMRESRRKEVHLRGAETDEDGLIRHGVGPGDGRSVAESEHPPLLPTR